jgi:hypothetical protein
LVSLRLVSVLSYIFFKEPSRDPKTPLYKEFIILNSTSLKSISKACLTILFASNSYITGQYFCGFILASAIKRLKVLFLISSKVVSDN